MSFSRHLVSSAVAAVTASVFMLVAAPAAAQQAPDSGRVSVTGKGIVGGIMLGSEAGLITVGAIGVKEWWPYLLAGAVGAGAGAVGGYFVEQVDPPSEPSLYMLAGGMALVIPTIVVVANGTAYDPSEDVEDGEEASDGDGEVIDLGNEARWRRPAFALLDIDATSAGLLRARPGIPAVSVTPMYSRQEVATYQVTQTNVVHVPLISGAF